MNRRVPPHSSDAERNVIACVLSRADLLGDVLDNGLAPEDFYTPKWASTFIAILDLHRQGEAIDSATVHEALGDAQPRPTPADLIGATSEVPSLSHAVTYARRVVDYARLRRVLGACAEIVEAGYGEEAKRDADKFYEFVERAMLEVTARRRQREAPGRLVDAVDAALDELAQRASGRLAGVPTGFVDLDDRLGGLRPGQLVVLGARPGMGKSAFAFQVAAHAADRIGPALFVSAEMGRVELGERSLARVVASDRLRAGRVDDLDWSRLRSRRDQLAGLPLLVDDSPGVTLASIRTRARRLASSGDGLALVVVDYLQLVDAELRRDRREREVADVASGLKLLARELRIPVLACAQLSRNLETRADKRPVLADLRESGQLEQDADVVLFLYREELYNADAGPGRAEVIIAKHRNGPTGSIGLAWAGQQMEFRNLAASEPF